MSQTRITKLERAILDLCRRLGFADAEVRCGKKHRKLFVDGRLIHVFSRGNEKDPKGGNGMRNIETRLRRLARRKNST